MEVQRELPHQKQMQKKKEESLLHDPTSVLDSLKLCGQKKDLQKARDLHGRLVRNEMLTKDIYLSNAVISMYAKCGSISEARKVFDELPIRNVVTWNTLITAYIHHGLAHNALESFRHMKSEGFSPNAFTYSCSLKSCDDIGILWKLHTEIEKQCFLESDLALGNMLVSLYAKTGSLNSSQQLFDRLQVQNVVSWSTIMEGHVIEGSSEKVFAYFQEIYM